jgi:hypothetical protein
LPWPTTPKEFFVGVAQGLTTVDELVPGHWEMVLRMMIVPFFESKCTQSKLTRISSFRGPLGFQHR